MRYRATYHLTRTLDISITGHIVKFQMMGLRCIKVHKRLLTQFLKLILMKSWIKTCWPWELITRMFTQKSILLWPKLIKTLSQAVLVPHRFKSTSKDRSTRIGYPLKLTQRRLLSCLRRKILSLAPACRGTFKSKFIWKNLAWPDQSLKIEKRSKNSSMINQRIVPQL